MCIIIDKPAGTSLDKADLIAAAERNDDGLGYMYVDPDTGNLETHRMLFTDGCEGKEFLEHWDALKNVHAVFHLRMCTHGGVTFDNVHPFKVLTKELHGRDLYFMHNGVLGNVPNSHTKSDTRMFNEMYLTPVLSQCPDMIFNKGFQSILAELSKGSRLLFMDDLGRIVRIGEWKVKGDCIVSNEYSFTPVQRVNYTGNYGYQGGNGGATGKQMSLITTDGTPMGTTEGVNVQPPFRDESTEKPSSKDSNISLQLATSIKQVLRKSDRDDSDSVDVDDRDDGLDDRSEAFDGYYAVGDRLVDGESINMSHVSHMEYDDLLDWTEQYPEQAVDVIRGLLDELDSLEQEHGFLSYQQNRGGGWRP